VSRFAFIAAVLCATPAFAQAAYFAGADDVPLPPGFTEVVQGLRFESDKGRIFVTSAEGRSSAAQIQTFYADALPQLGWAFSPGEQNAIVFHRGRETLSFAVREGAQRTHLSVRLVVRPAAMNAD
jgi:hypothetical protein